MSHTAIILNNSPVKEVNFDTTSPDSTFKVITRTLPGLKTDEVLIRPLIFSNDASQRSWIQKGLDPAQMYTEPVNEGDVMKSLGIAEVVESKLDEYKQGDIVGTIFGWAELAIVHKATIFQKIEDDLVPLYWHLDALGMTGLTAYFGLLEVAKLKSTDTIVISAASGATGSMCVQIAKHVIGCKVVGISGGAEKGRYVESIGADICIDYRAPDFAAQLAAAVGKSGCDVYFDCVGGEILSTVMKHIKHHGQVIACGAIAGYNDKSKGHVTSWESIIVRRLDVHGFIVFDYLPKFAEGAKEMLKWVHEGKIKVEENNSTIVDLTKDFEKIPETWGILYSDKKQNGKLLTKVGERSI